MERTCWLKALLFRMSGFDAGGAAPDEIGGLSLAERLSRYHTNESRSIDVDGDTVSTRTLSPSYDASMEALAHAFSQAEAEVQTAGEDNRDADQKSRSQKWSSLSYSTSMDEGDGNGDGEEEQSFDTTFNDLCMRSGISFDEDGIKLDDRSGEIVTEIVFESQRYVPLRGWSSKHHFPTDW